MSVTLNATSKGIDAAVAAIADLKKGGAGNALDAGTIRRAGRAASEALLHVERANTPVRSGALVSSLAIRNERSTANTYSAKVGTEGVIYNRIQEDGGRIYAKNARALAVHFPDGGILLVKSVFIPGQHYIENSLAPGDAAARAAVRTLLGA